MTNQKMSLGEKVGYGVFTISIVGAIGLGVSVDMAPMRKYKSLCYESEINAEVKSLDSKKLLSEDENVLQEYSVFKNDYKTNLESKLQELRASPQYTVEKKKLDEDEKYNLNKLCFAIISVFAGIYASIYVERKQKKRLAESKSSGASK